MATFAVAGAIAVSLDPTSVQSRTESTAATPGEDLDGAVDTGRRLGEAGVGKTDAEQQRVIAGKTFRPMPGSTVETASLVVPEVGPGVFQVAAAPSVSGGLAATTYRVEVERGLPFDLEATAAFIEESLSDPRGWAQSRALARVDGPADLRIVVATPETSDALCAPLETAGRLSCRNGSNVVLNGWRWAFGADSYGVDLSGYRRYLVNHETGHALGYAHVGCPSKGALAPVMLQQTKGLEGCRPNPWPKLVDLAPGG